LINSRSSLVAVGRNQCAGAAQIMKASHLLFLDSDMVFPADTLARLLAHNKDIVGATYSKRVPPFHPLTVTEEGEQVQITSGLCRVKLIPTGCLLMRTKIFDALAICQYSLVISGRRSTASSDCVRCTHE
jgi:hypothetical protein